MKSGGLGLGRLGDLRRVGSHVGDEADRLAAEVDALVKLLGDHSWCAWR